MSASEVPMRNKPPMKPAPSARGKVAHNSFRGVEREQYYPQEWTGRPGVLRFMGLQRVGHD